MERKIFLVLAVLVAAALLLVACGSADQPDPSLEPTILPATQETTQETPEPASTDEQTEPAAEESPEASAAAGTFTIVPAESQARFLIDEVLFGQDKTVVGATNDVAGSITPDFDNPSETFVNTITVDLSTLQTDDNNRTRAVHNRILETTNEAFRYATFEPTALTGLPDTITFGDPFSFQLTGDLTIHGVTLTKTFDVTATAVSETRIEGLASLAITYPEFDVQILRLPQAVASVEEAVILELEFVAEGSQ